MIETIKNVLPEFFREDCFFYPFCFIVVLSTVFLITGFLPKRKREVVYGWCPDFVHFFAGLEAFFFFVSVIKKMGGVFLSGRVPIDATEMSVVILILLLFVLLIALFFAAINWLAVGIALLPGLIIRGLPNLMIRGLERFLFKKQEKPLI